jgi:uncharacterized membrane protein YoaK (UPF0700 family)
MTHNLAHALAYWVCVLTALCLSEYFTARSFLVIIIIIIIISLSCHRHFIPGTSPLEPTVITNAQFSSFRQQYLPYYVTFPV